MSTSNGDAVDTDVNTATCSNRELVAAMIEAGKDPVDDTLLTTLTAEALRRMQGGTDPEYWITH